MELLYGLARHGVVSTTDCERAGIGLAQRRRLVRTNRLRPLIRGWYALPEEDGTRPWDVGPDWKRRECLHRLTTAALVRSFDGRAVASHYSCLILRGIAVWGVDLATAHLARVEDDHSRHRRGAVIHPAGPGVATEAPCGLLTVPVAEAIVGTGLLGAGQPDPSIAALGALVAADAALRHDLVTDAELEAELAARESTPGIVATRAFLAHRDARHESVGETRTAYVLRTLGLAFTPQVEVAIGDRSRVLDFLLDDYPVAIEFDGALKYRAGEDPDPLVASQVVVAEKLRESEIVDATGVIIVRLTWADLDKPALIAARVRAAIARAERRTRVA